MAPELKWLALSCVVTTLMWIPYILNMIYNRGLIRAMSYPSNPEPMSDWAERLKKAHYNAVENLVVFGLLVIVAHLANVHSSWTVLFCMTYFWSRLVYAVIYTAKIPIVRTLVFAVSWLSILGLAGSILL